MTYDSMSDKLKSLETDCELLRSKLVQQNELQNEVEMLKNEIESLLETHQKLQDVALALEQENRTMQEKYSGQLKETTKFNALKIELEHEIETKTLSYQSLEKKYNKTKEKADNIEDLEEQIYNFEKLNKRQTEKIKDLQEDIEALEQGNAMRKKENQDMITKLSKENSELTLKLETYIEEMEELDSKVESLENENQELKNQVDRINNIELFGSNVTEVEELQHEKEELTNRLSKEILRRENFENELFKIEEEFENYKIKLEEEETESGISEDSSEEIKNDIKINIRKKKMKIENLEGEKKELECEVCSLKEEREILLDENSGLAKSNLSLEEKLRETQSMYDDKIKEYGEKINGLENTTTELEAKVSEMTERKKQMEQENFDRLVSAAEKEYQYSQKCISYQEENERCKNQLKVAEEYLRLVTDKNSELQSKMQSMFIEHERALSETKYNVDENRNEERKPFMDDERSSSNEFEGSEFNFELLSGDEKNRVLNRIRMKFEHDRTEYESRIFNQGIMIQDLEDRMSALRNFYENKSINGSSTPSPETTPPVAMKNGRLHDSMDVPSLIEHNGQRRTLDDQLDGEDTLSDRELRRIAYKIVDGGWKRLPDDLGISLHDSNQILNCPSNDQEKVYRLLVCWRSDQTLSRLELIKKLVELIDPKRKDVSKFLKEMSGNGTKEGTLKNRFQKFKRSVKR